MTDVPSTASPQTWHTDDLLVRLARGESVVPFVDNVGGYKREVSDTPADAKFGVATLALLSGDPQRQERLSALRDKSAPERDLAVFAARSASAWALDALCGRLTNHAHYWQSVRASILDATSTNANVAPVIGDIPLDSLYGLSEALYERNVDLEACGALLRYIANEVNAGGKLHEQYLEPLAERLLQFDLADAAQAVFPRLTNHSWVRHCIGIELQHPRFGGSFDSMLRLLNEPYNRVGIEQITLGADAESDAFQRLSSTALTAIENGPLVSIIMTTATLGPETIPAVRSIIGQSYQAWELIIIDDGSPHDSSSLLEEIANLDARIHVVRHTSTLGEFVRRNEAMQAAKGDFITMHEPDSWSHPRRLEIQVSDLIANPSRLANVLHGVRLSQDLSFVGRPGSKLFIAESTLMFRRQETIQAIGFFDSVRTGADSEFRMRLERGTGLTVPVLLPGAPLEFLRGDDESFANGRYGINLWNYPDRTMYLSGAHRYLERIQADEASPIVDFPLVERPFAAPAQWDIHQSSAPLTFDLLVILDGRQFSKLREFHGAVTAELQQAVDAGLRVAFLHSYSLGGPRGRAFLSPGLQDLIDSGAVTRIVEGDVVQADVVVVRHAGAAQGHPNARRSMNASRVVVVEDPSGRDIRGYSFAKPDVDDTVAAWFGLMPEWEVAAPTLPESTVAALSFDNGRIEIALTTPIPRSIHGIRLSSEAKSVVLTPAKTAPETVVGYAEAAELTGGAWTVTIEFDAGAGRTASASCPLTTSTVILNESTFLVAKTDESGFAVLPAEKTDALPERAGFIASFLSASLEQASVIGEELHVDITQGVATSLSRVYAIRKVGAGVVRRRDFAPERSANTSNRFSRPLTKLVDSRWQLVGSFRTPIGLVEYPIHVSDEAGLVGNESWMPQIRANGALLVVPPAPGRLTRVATRVYDSVSSKLTELGTGARRRSANASLKEAIHFDATHGEARVEATPTVTVVMPVYNVEPFLDVAIASVLNQDFADLELILIDDASTDNGRHIIRKYWRSDPRVRVFALDHNTIGGAGVPSNIGIRAARGEYLAFADSDDFVTAGGLAKLVALAESHEADLVIGDFKTFSEKLPDGAESYDRKVWAELPMNAPISAFEHPALFRLSPVPWRKLYRRSFLQEHAIEYPEGDYFYEDNPLHWFVLSRARCVVMCDEVISNHRMEREGQTMGAATYKLGAFVSHMNTIRNFLATSQDKNRNVLFEAFYDYLARTNWVAKNQTQQAANELIRYGMNGVYQRARLDAPTASVAPNLRARLASYDGAYPDLDLTVVIPVYNSADLLKQTLDSVLAMTDIRFNVLLNDDGSTDDSLSILQEYENAHPNVHVFNQGNRGAGRARNAILPLASGRYTFFLDADDVIDPEALVSAVAHADAESADLLFMKYGIEHADEGRSEGMFKADRQVWRQLRTSVNNAQRQRLVAQLINYPWNRLIRTTLLHDANIFFGATVVHNDVQFHWHTIVSAKNIGFTESTVTTHRKFATRAQVTNIEDGRRMAVLEALRATHERIVLSDAYPIVQDEWEKFALHLLGWAKNRIPESLQATYEARRRELETAFSN